MNKENKNSIKKDVLKFIEEGRVEMRPKWKFVAESTAIILITFIIALILLQFVSFIIFATRQSGISHVSGFGWQGLRLFFLSLPWILVLVSLMLFAVLEVLIKKSNFVAKKPLVYSLVFIVFFIAIGNFIIERVEVHQTALHYANERRLPVVGAMYRGYALQDRQEVHPGRINELKEDGFYMISKIGDIYNVTTSNETVYFPPESKLDVEDYVVVLGEDENGMINAVLVKKIRDDAIHFPQRKGLRRPIPFTQNEFMK